MGTAGNDVRRLLGLCKFKELVFLLYQFLNTYSPSNPFVQFSSWAEFRTKEGRFDEDGNLLSEKKQQTAALVSFDKVNQPVIQTVDQINTREMRPGMSVLT